MESKYRASHIKNCLINFFPKVIVELINKYDYYLKGEYQSYVKHKSSVESIAVLPDGKIISGSLCGLLKIWNPQTTSMDADINNYEYKLIGHTKSINCIELLPDEKIITGSDDLTIKIWNLQLVNNRNVFCEHTLSEHYDRIWCIKVLPDLFRVVSGSADFTLRVWNLKHISENNKSDLTLNVGAIVLCVDVLLDDETNFKIVSGSIDGKVKIWNLQTKMCECVLKDDNDSIWSMIIIPYDELQLTRKKQIITGTKYGAIKIWNIETKKCNVLIQETDNSSVRCLANLPDGRIVSGLNHCTLKIWDLSHIHKSNNTIKCDLTLHGHTDKINCVKVLPNGKIISGSADSSINIWS